MLENLSDSAKHQAYLVSILLAAMVVRVLVGLAKPVLGLEQGVIVGLATVVFLSPTLHRVCFGVELLDSARKRWSHAGAMLLAAGLFLYYVALAA